MLPWIFPSDPPSITWLWIINPFTDICWYLPMIFPWFARFYSGLQSHSTNDSPGQIRLLGSWFREKTSELWLPPATGVRLMGCWSGVDGIILEISNEIMGMVWFKNPKKSTCSIFFRMCLYYYFMSWYSIVPIHQLVGVLVDHPSLARWLGVFNNNTETKAISIHTLW